MKHARCPKCGHEVREHQPVYGTWLSTGGGPYVGCQVCNCILSMMAKLKAWDTRKKAIAP